ncbi:DUF3130 family protein [Staphylococcus xylosus]|uniref:DUF3130 family protein n=1 Tax=Staphylococcus xylosus TaxID=1288 RepID=UPI001CDB57E7|nr:DUF3130 family protein [Staphylococcus xylosus]MCM3518702.1 DUF3130 family protein [Staphylococcus xylosus]MCQ3817432.1 DUF3130 family protein [Staphylococcus xylosus]MCQ3820135.1 DUF3130 family protein [Staphylococcus xylosus]UBV37541.1 DUF3130 family protein [Staphylococcus xylosus]
MAKEIYLDPIEFQNQLSKFENGETKIKSTSVEEIKEAKNEIILDSINKLNELVDDLTDAINIYSKMIKTDAESMDKIAATIKENDQNNASKISTES